MTDRIGRGAGTTSALRAQYVMAATLALCTALMPQFLFSANMGGISNYGVHRLTVAPYTAGTVAAAVLLWRSTHHLMTPSTRFVVVVRAACACILLNLATTYPYKSGPVWATVHSWTAILLALVEFGGGIALLRSIPRSAFRRGAALLLALGFTCLVLTYIDRLHILFVAEFATAAGFGALVVLASRHLDGTPDRAETGSLTQEVPGTERPRLG